MDRNRNRNPYAEYLSSVSNSVGYYFLITTLPIGLIANLISLYIYTRTNLNRKTNTGFLYAWLSIFNVLSNLQYTFITKSSLLFNYRVNLPCGVSNYIRRTAFNMVSWMQVLISFDRFMGVLYPSKGYLMNSKRGNKVNKKRLLEIFMLK